MPSSGGRARAAGRQPGSEWTFLSHRLADPENKVLTVQEQNRDLREDWCAPFAGSHLYYPARQGTRAFELFKDALRAR